MSENTNAIIPQQGATNETLLGDFSSYFRWNEERRQYEMNTRINPASNYEEWVTTPSSIRDMFSDPGATVTVGMIVAHLNTKARQYHAEAERANDTMEKAMQAIEIIGRRLIEEAEHRGWCEQFDGIIDEVNGELPTPFQLPTRRKPRRQIEVTINANVSVNRTVWVDDDCDDDTDPDNWYSEEDAEEGLTLGTTWADEQVADEVSYNGFDSVECSTY